MTESFILIVPMIFSIWWLISLIPPMIIKGRMKYLKGLALAPFIFATNRPMEETEWTYLIRHETEHIRQQRKFSPLFFLILYGLEYLINRIKGMDHFQAYWNLTFEKQAREAERRNK